MDSTVSAFIILTITFFSPNKILAKKIWCLKRLSAYVLFTH